MKEILRTEVAGVKHSDYQVAGIISPGTTVLMYWERSNAYDPNAIRLEIGGKKIGYIPKEKTHLIHEYRKQGIKLECEVTAYNKTNPTWMMIYVKVMAPEVEERAL